MFDSVELGDIMMISYPIHVFQEYLVPLNHLLLRLFLDHDIIFYFKTALKKFRKNLSSVLNTFESIMENGAFTLLEQMSNT